MKPSPTENTEGGVVDEAGPGAEHDTVGEVEHVDVVVEGGGEAQPEGGEQGPRQGRGPQSHPVCEDSGQEGEEESGADGERSHQRTLEGSLLLTRCLQVFLQFDEDDPEGVDDAEDDPVDDEGADHDQPGLTINQLVC